MVHRAIFETRRHHPRSIYGQRNDRGCLRPARPSFHRHRTRPRILAYGEAQDRVGNVEPDLAPTREKNCSDQRVDEEARRRIDCLCPLLHFADSRCRCATTVLWSRPWCSASAHEATKVAQLPEAVALTDGEYDPTTARQKKAAHQKLGGERPADRSHLPSGVQRRQIASRWRRLVDSVEILIGPRPQLVKTQATSPQSIKTAHTTANQILPRHCLGIRR